MAVYDQGQAPMTGAARAGALVNYAGAAVSLALIVGVGVWGYKLVVRDVSGIPVVRAMAGDASAVQAALNETPEIAAPTGPLSTDDILALADQIAAGAAPSHCGCCCG